LNIKFVKKTMCARRTSECKFIKNVLNPSNNSFRWNKRIFFCVYYQCEKSVVQLHQRLPAGHYQYLLFQWSLITQNSTVKNKQQHWNNMFWHLADRASRYIYLSNQPTWCTKFLCYNKFYFMPLHVSSTSLVSSHL